jgi:hypothetical protein
MFPRSTSCGIIDVLAVNAILFCEDRAVAGNVFTPDATNQIVCQFGATDSSANGIPFPGNHIANIVLVSSFDDVARIETKSNVASMASAGKRPATVGQKESDSMDALSFAVELNSAVPALGFASSPQEAFIGIMFGDGINEPRESGRLVRHLRSFIARVWAFGCLQQSSAF